MPKTVKSLSVTVQSSFPRLCIHPRFEREAKDVVLKIAFCFLLNGIYIYQCCFWEFVVSQMYTVDCIFCISLHLSVCLYGNGTARNFFSTESLKELTGLIVKSTPAVYRQLLIRVHFMWMKYLSNYLSFRIWCFLTTPQSLMPHLVMMIKKLSATTGSNRGELVQISASQLSRCYQIWHPDSRS